MTDLALVNARLSSDQTDGRLVDVTVTDGVIAAITPAAMGGNTFGGPVEVINLDGRWLLPGLWDHHIHANQQALAVRRIDLSAAAAAVEAARTMADALPRARLAEGHPLVGHGFRDGLWPHTPTLEVLDAAVPGVPAVLISADLHCAWLNTPALALYGHTGHPTGVFREDDCFEVIGKLGHVADATLDDWVAEAAKAAAARGVVGVVDYEMTDNIASWSRRFAGGFSALRIQAGLYSEHLDAAMTAGHFTGEVIDGTRGLLTVGGFKILTDGSLNTRTAYCVDNYPGTHDRGLLTVPPDALVPLLRKAWSAGVHPAVHAIGDEANRLALDAFETVGCHGRIEHAQLVLEQDFPRFAALGVAASVQPEHAMDDRDIAEHFWAGRTDRAFALRRLLDSGAQLLLGSDAPVAPLNPWVTMSAAVSRSRDGRESWHPEQAISVAEALAASTHNTVARGELADLIAVDFNPFSASGDDLRGMPVALTVLGGSVTHRAV